MTFFAPNFRSEVISKQNEVYPPICFPAETPFTNNSQT
ncbi:hypothetical protein FEM08_20600 [Flavobacterium gilvum]|nr:hypothetical protein FEM08_20600 [Flavobacterium gilvum]